jgi:hypothetical protein
LANSLRKHRAYVVKMKAVDIVALTDYSLLTWGQFIVIKEINILISSLGSKNIAQ